MTKSEVKELLYNYIVLIANYLFTLYLLIITPRVLRVPFQGSTSLWEDLRSLEDGSNPAIRALYVEGFSEAWSTVDHS